MKSLIRTMRYPRLVALLSALIIGIGALLLTLPMASKSGTWTPFMDALFTSTSAYCVTGLLLYDTYSHWSMFGQLTILTLTQIGGIGFMMVATFFSLLLKRRIGLNERILLQEATGSLSLGGIVRLTKRILLGTLLFESVGAILLALRFSAKMGVVEGIYYAIFHSISAFCNAGFDLMGKYGEFSSLTMFAADPFVLGIISSLVIIGSIGFFVWDDLLKNTWHWSHYSLHTKVVLVVTAILIAAGSVLFFIAEYGHSMATMTGLEKVTNSLFQSIAYRTAGFNTVETFALSNLAIVWTILLMIIGGSPGSTAGGIKTTTIFMMSAVVLATLRSQRDITAFKRRLEETAFRKACTIVVVYMAIAFSGISLLCLFQDLPLVSVVFEVFSAIGTVGLTLGITSQLTIPSKVVILCLMYFGRIGILSLIYSLIKEHSAAKLQYPQDKLIIG